MLPNLPFKNIGPDLSQIFGALQNVVSAINNLQQTVFKVFPLGLTSSAIYDPPNIAAGSQATTTVACAGAVLGMSAQAAFSLDLSGIALSAYVSAADTITCIFFNGTAGALDLGSGTLSVWARSN